MPSEREIRIGKNEAIFRDVNERLEKLNEAFSKVTDVFQVVCECGDATCAEQLEIAKADYERVRSDSALFVLAPGHDDPAAEDVVETTAGYAIVRKRPGIPQQIAEQTDPRAL